MHIIIPGQTPSQKNNKQIVPSKPPRLVDNAIVKKWRKDTAKYLREAYKQNFNGKQVIATYMFYLKDRTRRDIDNMTVSCNDALVEAGILERDDWQVLQSGGAGAIVDNENPRAEIWLTEDEWRV